MSQKAYEISIITPVHKVRIDMFEQSFKSMKNQTYGFENIEWIVVLHNCTDEEAAAYEAILDGYDNVRAIRLNNEVRSPSSPRNYGLELATGTYVGFLDGDDRYTSWCIEKVVGYLNENGADLCHFRRMVELEKEGGIILNELVMWDQTKETILVNRDNWDGERLFVGTWGMCTSKIYRRDFLIENNIRFDDSISFAEDYDFSISAYALAKNICLAPQMIGYVYFVNGSSLVQTTKVDNEVLLRYAKGFKKLFNKGLSMGIYMNDSMGMLLLYVAILVNVCPDLDPAVRKEVADMMEPYVRMLKPIAASKIYAGGRNDRMNTLPKKILLGESAVVGNYIYRIDETSPVTVLEKQKDALAAILKLGMNSDFGKRYHFTDLLTMEEYRRQVPMADYAAYQPLIDLTVNIGEKGIFTDEIITSYAVTHDGDGRSKRFPFTEQLLSKYVSEFRELVGTGTVFTMLESLPYKSSRLTMDIKYTNTVMGLILTEYMAQNSRSYTKSAKFVTPPELLFPKTLCDFDYVRLLFALSEREIDTVYAPNAWTLYAGTTLMYRKWNMLCDDIENGRLSDTKDIPADIVTEINSKLRSDPERAAQLRTVFEQADGKPKLTEIWPNLSRVIADGTGSFAIYKKNVSRYLGNADYSNGFLADEYSFYGSAVGDDFRLEPEEGFYEFLPYGCDGAAPCFAHELKEGGEYTVIISNKAGLFRYKTDLLVKCVKADEKEIIISKRCPITYDLALMRGLREEQLSGTVALCGEMLGITAADYTLMNTEDPERFILVIEPETDDELKKASSEDLSAVAAACTEQLRSDSGDGEIVVQLSLCEPEAHLLFRDIQMLRRGVLADGIDPCHITDQSYAKMFFHMDV